MKAEPVLDLEGQAQRRIGEVLSGKWRLEKLLGVGGMAAVYAATHENNDRGAAIKILHLEASLNQEVKRRFLREGYIANKVKHPGAVAVLDDGVTEDGAAYLVMELCVGETLQEHLDRHGQADEITVLRWTAALLDVLALAHKQGIVHRDLKPDNVFVLQDGSVKVLDFGIARIQGGLGDLRTQAGLVLGTPSFMPPEQARGQAARIDGRTDLWAVGAIMLAALTGKRVHSAKTPQEALYLAMTEAAKSMSELAPELSPKIAAIIDKALEFEPEARWDDALAMSEAVAEALASFMRDPTLLAKPAKPMWPPPPVGVDAAVKPAAVKPAPAVPVAARRVPRPSLTDREEHEPPSGVRRPSKAPTKIETPLTAKAEPEAPGAPVEDVENLEIPKEPRPPLGISGALTAAEADFVSAKTMQGDVPMTGAQASVEAESVAVVSQPISDTPPLPAHLQSAEGRSLEAGSPLLDTHERRRRVGVAALILGLVAVAFGAALLLQHSAPVRMALGLEAPPPLDDETALVAEPASEPVPAPTDEAMVLAEESPTEVELATEETNVDASAPVADPAPVVTPPPAAKHGVTAAARPRVVTPPKKPAPKKPAPKKPAPKKKR